jgi:CHC2 zinc finger
MSENSELRQKIDKAKHGLPLPALMRQLGLAEHAKKSARCPFPDHEDKHPSFSIFKGNDGFWHYKCMSRCGDGDEITFLSNLRGISRTEAISLYLEMAGFPRTSPPKSREYPKYPEPHKSPEYPVSLVSEGQADALKRLGAARACIARNTARNLRWQLVRDLRAVEKSAGGELDIAYLLVAFNEWYRLSQPFLDPAKTREDYLAKFLAELRKVRVPTGEGAITTALEAVSALSASELPLIPGLPDPPESWRRVAALHRELSRQSADAIYYLGCREAAKASPGLSHQRAYEINLALARLGVIEVITVGDQNPNGGKASEFRYLLGDITISIEEEEKDVEF